MPHSDVSGMRAAAYLAPVGASVLRVLFVSDREGRAQQAKLWSLYPGAEIML